eukprot:1445662-Lingulodinium_polyedra.AAC.1
MSMLQSIAKRSMGARAVADGVVLDVDGLCCPAPKPLHQDVNEEVAPAACDLVKHRIARGGM